MLVVQLYASTHFKMVRVFSTTDISNFSIQGLHTTPGTYGEPRREFGTIGLDDAAVHVLATTAEIVILRWGEGDSERCYVAPLYTPTRESGTWHSEMVAPQ